MTIELLKDLSPLDEMSTKELNEVRAKMRSRVEHLGERLKDKAIGEVEVLAVSEEVKSLVPEFQKFTQESNRRAALLEAQAAGLGISTQINEAYREYKTRYQIGDGAAAKKDYHGDSPPVSRATPAEKGTMFFKDLSTGREVRSLSHREKLSSGGSDVDIGELIFAMCTGQGLELFNQVGASDGAGGYLLTPAVGANVIDLARSASIAMRAGAQTIDMPTAELALVKIDTDPTPQWLPESSAATVATANFGRITLRVQVPISIELLEDAQNGAREITTLLQRVLAQKLDEAVLIGSGATEPRGIINDPGTNSIDMSSANPTTYNDVSNAVKEVLKDNYNGAIEDLAWVSHPDVLALYDQLADTTNQPMLPTPWVAALRKFATTTLAAPTDGDMIVGDFSQVLIGVRTAGITIRVVDGGTMTGGGDAVDAYSRTIVAAMRRDVAILQPTWFTHVENVGA